MELTEKQLAENYLKQLAKVKATILERYSDELDTFSDFCRACEVQISPEDIDYLDTTGLVVKQSALVDRIFNHLKKDKDGLYSWAALRALCADTWLEAGFIPTAHFVLMAHPYFRRNMNAVNNFAPRFVDLFWQISDPEIDAYIAIDVDRVRPILEPRFYMEADTWFGAPFDESINKIPDGISKLRPPLDLEDGHRKSLFNSVYSLDIKWSRRGNIKTFQALEFKSPEILVEFNGCTYHPVRYMHAEYDLLNSSFRHFDGAVHHHSPENYYRRRDMDFNFEKKSASAHKALSVKLFKFNGSFAVDFWVNFSCHFLTGNPLIFEYFSGQYPSYVTEILEKIRTGNMP